MPVNWIDHQEQRILYCDFRDMRDPQEILDNFKLAVKFSLETDGSILYLDDFTGARTGSSFMLQLKKYAKEVFNKKRKRTAVIGLTSTFKILLNAYNLVAKDQVKYFNSKHEALDYLVTGKG